MEENVGREAVYKDRSTGLIIVGVIEILIAVCCALLVPLSLLVVAMSGGWGVGVTDLRSTLPLLILYAVTAFAFCWIGVGSIRARRWARDLMVSLSWIWLVTGVCNFVLTLVLLPTLLGTVTSEYPPELVPIISWIVVVFLLISCVVLPVSFLLFYRSPNVVATCRARGPERQWTDGVSDRLLTFAIVWALMAASVVMMPAYGWFFPFFGVVLSGAAGAVLWLVVLAVCLVLAWGGVRRKEWAWSGSFAATLAVGVSTVLTFLIVDSNQIVAAMDLPEEQAVIMVGVLSASRWAEAGFWLVVWGTFLVYLITVRKYFLQERKSV